MNRWPRLRALPWARIGLATVAVLLLIGLVPPLRSAAANITSKVILFVASPLAPDVSGFEELGKPTRVLGADGSEIGVLGPEQSDPIPLDRLPPHVVQAVLAAEDADFYEHGGVDPDAAVRALFNTVKGNAQGGSTITQQLAKLNYTGAERTVLRKLKEVLYATELENKYTKDQLLQRYVNQVYFGRGAYGIGLASSRFFGVPPEELTPAQAAVLAGKIRAPNALDPYDKPDEVRVRRDQVLRNMARHRWLSDPELNQALAAPLGVTDNPPPDVSSGGGKAPHFVSYVAREAAGLSQLGGSPDERERRVLSGGYTIETTLDVKDQEAAAAAAQGVLGGPDDPTTAIASVQPGDGAIRILFGGLDPEQHFDPASQGRRQPGSSFKPYVYLAMLEERIDPRTTFDAGSPKTLDCQGAPWTVNNYEGDGAGSSSVDDGMVHSINTVFAQVMIRVGPTATKDAAVKAGISEDDLDPPECAMALGGLRRGVSPLQQAAGFATFAAKGVYAEPYAITKINDRDGDTIYEHKKETRNAFDEDEVGVLNAVLQRVVTEGTGKGAAIGRPLAGKTGTTENYGNAWFIGYVPQLSTAVWVGHPEGDVPMTNVRGRSVSGGSFPATVFSRFMRPALSDVPVRELFTASVEDLGLRPSASSTTPPPTTPPPTVDETTTSTFEFTATVPLPPIDDGIIDRPSPTFPPGTSQPTVPRPTTTTTTTTSTTIFSSPGQPPGQLGRNRGD